MRQHIRDSLDFGVPIETPHYLAQTGAFVAEGCREGSRSRPHRRLSVAAVEEFDAGANFAAIQGNSRRLPSLCRQYRRAARHQIDAPAEEIAHNRDLHNLDADGVNYDTKAFGAGNMTPSLALAMVAILAGVAGLVIVLVRLI